MEVVPGTGDIWTKESFQAFTLHLEFRTPRPTDGDTAVQRGNSGVFLIGDYEIQIADTPGVSPGPGDCGAVCSLIAPAKNVALPPMEWQSYDIRFRGPKFDQGKKIDDARLTLVWNGVKVHDIRRTLDTFEALYRDEPLPE